MYDVVEPNSNVQPPFLITWESTLKCNLDCSYCSSHDNSIPHPSLKECCDTLDFLYEYVDVYMNLKVEDQRHVSLNIFGGESLFHPNIVEILEYAIRKHKEGNYIWSLGISTITNGIVKPKIWNDIIRYFDFLTVSHHAETTVEEKKLFKNNLLVLKEDNKNFQVSILKHPDYVQEYTEMIDWCEQHQIKYWARNLDGPRKASQEQTITFVQKNNVLRNTPLGRSCCGGQTFNVNQNYETPISFIDHNRFVDWHCSVNYFFVFVKQITQEVFVNKDCRMGYDGKYGPIGYLYNTDAILNELKQRTVNKSVLPIICKKERCWCGLCTPKAKTENLFNDIIGKYLLQE